MSKLYKKYVLLKVQNSNNIYVFESGIFYLFIDEDAKLMSNILGLKLTNLNSFIVKCGFPVRSADKYFNLLKSLNYNVEIVPADNNFSPTNVSNYLTTKQYHNIIQDFLRVDVDSLSISQAFDLLADLQNKFNSVEMENKENEEKE